MPKSRVTRWLRSSVWADRLLACIALSPVVVLLVRQFTELGNRTVPCCDFASLELGTRALLRGEQFVGLYSREGWRHPGPAPFLWSSLARPLPGHSFAEHQIAAALLSLIAMSTVIAASWHRVTAIGRSVIVTLVAVFLLRFDIDTLRVPWNPYGAFLWVLIAVISTVVFVQSRSPMWVAVAVVSGSMAAQTHIGAAPTVAVCFITVVVEVLRNRHRREMPRVVWTAGGLFAIMWFLPLADLAFGNRNLLKIFTTSSQEDVAMSRVDVVKGTMWILGNSPGRIGDTFGPASPYEAVRSVFILDVIALVVVLALAVLALFRFRRDRFTGSLSALALGSSALTVVALSLSNGPFLRYLLLPTAGLGLLLWIVAGLTASRFFQRHELNVVRLLAWPTVVTVTVVSFVGMTSRQFTDQYRDDDVQAVVDDIGDSCASLPNRAIVDVGKDVEWFDALPVVVALDRCVTVRVIGRVGFLAGQPYQAEDQAVPNVSIDTSDEKDRGTTIAESRSLRVALIDPGS